MSSRARNLSASLRPVIERCREPVLQAFHDANIEPSRIDRLVFVGGPTRMPMVRAFFEEIVGHKGETGIDPMECVAQGAAIQAGVLAGEVGAIVLVDVTPLTLGIETLGGVATPLHRAQHADPGQAVGNLHDRSRHADQRHGARVPRRAADGA